MRPSKKVLLQVLWTGVDDSVPCFYLFTDTKRYMFNCSEGMQRLFTQYKIKIGKLDTFFFTRHSWSHIGGFPGFAMTLRDAKSLTASSLASNASLALNTPAASNKSLEHRTSKKKHNGKEKRKMNVKQEQINTFINVHGPQGIQNILSATHSFMRFDNSRIKINVYEHDKSSKKKDHQDSEIIVHSFPIYGLMPLKTIGGHFPNNRLIEPLHPSLVCSPPSICYACHLQPLPGRFLPAKAKELGVPKGPLFGKLSKREQVTLADGTVISPEQVMEEDIPGMTMLVVDLPAESYIQSLTNYNSIEKYTTADHAADLVLHLAQENICTHEEYQEWVGRFPTTTKHIYFYGLTQHSVTFKGQNSLQQMLNYIQKETFPLIDIQVPKYFSMDKEDTLYNFSSLNLRELLSNFPLCYDHSQSFTQHPGRCLVERAKELLVAALDTQHDKTLQASTCKEVETEKSSTELVNANGKRPCEDTGLNISVKRQELDSNLIIQPVTEAARSVFPKVVCLGTGAAIPSKYRNVSSTIVFLREETAVILDCGEDTYGQLLRHYGDVVDEVLKKIKVILISHLHADHHLGLFTIVRKINQIKEPNESDVFVVAPHLYKDWFVQYGETSELLRCQFVSCRKLYSGSKLYKDINVQSVRVEHPAMAHGFVVGYGDKGDKIVYSGDTLPCEALISAGKDCSLLIHEATLEDNMVEEALSRKHSTTMQALEVGEKMNAKYVLLTHFSQRYPKIPVFNTEVPIVKRTAIAFDHMEISLEAIPQFHKLFPKLSALFAAPEEEEKEGVKE